MFSCHFFTSVISIEAFVLCQLAHIDRFDLLDCKSQDDTINHLGLRNLANFPFNQPNLLWLLALGVLPNLLDAAGSLIP